MRAEMRIKDQVGVRRSGFACLCLTQLKLKQLLCSALQAVVAEHFGLAPSNGGYRFGNHPLTRGPVRPGTSFHLSLLP